MFTLFGLLIGEAGLGIVDLGFGHTFVHTLAELTLVLVLFSDAARIELAGLKTDHILPFRMLVIGMPFVIIFGMLMALALPLGLGFRKPRISFANSRLPHRHARPSLTARARPTDR